MTAALTAPTDWTGAPDDIVRTETGERLHVPSCPHLGSAVRLATAEELAEMTVCTWCRAELDGHGRVYFDDLTDAMRQFGVHVENQPRVRTALQAVEFSKLWMPNSKSYVALGFENRAVAWFGKTYAMPTRTEVVEFPDFAGASRGGRAAPDDARGVMCDEHFIEKSVTGTCELCD